MSDFVDAYRRDTGEKVRIPRTHLAVFPEAFRLTPRQKAADSKPATGTTRAAQSATDTKE